MNNIEAAGQGANTQGKNMARHTKRTADQDMKIKASAHGANTPAIDYKKKAAGQGMYKKKAVYQGMSIKAVAANNPRQEESC